jgi:hypothetical protein
MPFPLDLLAGGEYLAIKKRLHPNTRVRAEEFEDDFM